MRVRRNPPAFRHGDLMSTSLLPRWHRLPWLCRAGEGTTMLQASSLSVKSTSQEEELPTELLHIIVFRELGGSSYVVRETRQIIAGRTKSPVRRKARSATRLAYGSCRKAAPLCFTKKTGAAIMATPSLYHPAILIYRIAGQINLLIPKYAGSALVQLSLVE